MSLSREERLAKDRARKAQWRATLSQDELAAVRAEDRKKKAAYRKTCTAEQRAALLARESAKGKRYYAANKERVLARREVFAEANRERVVMRDWAGHLRRQYGLTVAAYNAMYEAQKGECAICGQTVEHIDHDHSTGRVRGLLCRGCNLGIGNFRDSVEILTKAIRYLEQHNAVA